VLDVGAAAFGATDVVVGVAQARRHFAVDGGAAPVSDAHREAHGFGVEAAFVSTGPLADPPCVAVTGHLTMHARSISIVTSPRSVERDVAAPRVDDDRSAPRLQMGPRNQSPASIDQRQACSSASVELSGHPLFGALSFDICLFAAIDSVLSTPQVELADWVIERA